MEELTIVTSGQYRIVVRKNDLPAPRDTSGVMLPFSLASRDSICAASRGIYLSAAHSTLLTCEAAPCLLHRVYKNHSAEP